MLLSSTLPNYAAHKNQIMEKNIKHNVKLSFAKTRVKIIEVTAPNSHINKGEVKEVT